MQYVNGLIKRLNRKEIKDKHKIDIEKFERQFFFLPHHLQYLVNKRRYKSNVCAKYAVLHKSN